MKTKIALIVLLFINLNLLAQVKFETGYFINKENQKIECLIKNEKWNVDSGLFEYKTTQNATIKQLSFKNINEISISKKLKYKRYVVEIDENMVSDLNYITTDRSTKMKEKSLLLKFILQGNVSFLKNKMNGVIRYFYLSEDTKLPEQLIYKKYLTKEGIKEYNNYKQQLALKFNCEELNSYSFKKLTYTERSLTNFFENYNDCKNLAYKKFKEFNTEKKFFFKLKGGIAMSSILLTKLKSNPFDIGYEANFGTKITPIIGFEAEYFFPTKKNNFSFYIDPKYRSYKGSVITKTNNVTTENITIDYQLIEIPINLRYYLYLNNNSKIAINLGAAFQSDLNSSLNYEISDQFGSSTKLKTATPFIFGLGYHFDKFALELKYSSRNISDSILIPATYQNLDLLLSYTLF